MYPGLFELPSVLFFIFKYNFAYVPALGLFILLYYQGNIMRQEKGRPKKRKAQVRNKQEIHSHNAVQG